MSLKDIMSEDVANVLFNPDEFAEPAKYNGKDILVIPEIGEENRKGNTFTEKGSADRAHFLIQETDVKNPKSSYMLIHNGKKWRVARTVETVEGIHRVECTGRESAF